MSSGSWEEARIAIKVRERRIQELLEENTRFIEERRAVDLHAMVRQFHRAGEYSVRHSPMVPPEEEIRFRLRLIVEEFFEMLEACFGLSGSIEDAREKIAHVLKENALFIDLPELVDAWADLKYVIVGSEVQFGIDGNAVFRLVHEANMAKHGPGGGRDETGKTKKPPGWTPPDIAGELERQRQEEAKR